MSEEPVILNAVRQTDNSWYCTGELPPDGTYVLAQEIPGNGRVLQERGWLTCYDPFPGTGKTKAGYFHVKGLPIGTTKTPAWLVHAQTVAREELKGFDEAFKRVRAKSLQAPNLRVEGMRALRDYLVWGHGYPPGKPTEELKDGDRSLFEDIDAFIAKEQQ